MSTKEAHMMHLLLSTVVATDIIAIVILIITLMTFCPSLLDYSFVNNFKMTSFILSFIVFLDSNICYIKVVFTSILTSSSTLSYDWYPSPLLPVF
ncbi:hypothetical protein DDB_G0294158 [Dictyostelium discoideum AX4]|uniref:hypothetical protein n=1 Tax=Dictyostelium discoideum AX4 TaxID=352472 RepID=UPI00004E344F|nr:hypothetical protein DDB_G0294158 [Dictyostelium discoideum AX4]EAL60407.1 hypothetical protein DDB_G0294158 [Dictyostelium discoideum AX4]|eukprot:XP_628820.1 hypothetical protein DDB_G0294158 [Dictyostelium discoideum AX4]